MTDETMLNAIKRMTSFMLDMRTEHPGLDIQCMVSGWRDGKEHIAVLVQGDPGDVMPVISTLRTSLSIDLVVFGSDAYGMHAAVADGESKQDAFKRTLQRLTEEFPSGSLQEIWDRYGADNPFGVHESLVVCASDCDGNQGMTNVPYHREGNRVIYTTPEKDQVIHANTAGGGIPKMLARAMKTPDLSKNETAKLLAEMCGLETTEEIGWHSAIGGMRALSLLGHLIVCDAVYLDENGMGKELTGELELFDPTKAKNNDGNNGPDDADPRRPTDGQEPTGEAGRPAPRQ